MINLTWRPSVSHRARSVHSHDAVDGRHLEGSPDAPTTLSCPWRALRRRHAGFRLLCGVGSQHGPNSGSRRRVKAVACLFADSSRAADSTAPAAGIRQPAYIGRASAPESSDGLTAQEAADRAAVEAQWVKSWDVYMRWLTSRRATARRWPTPSRSIPRSRTCSADAAKLDSQGLRTYGQPRASDLMAAAHRRRRHRTIADCQDRSQAGALNAATATRSPSAWPATTL